MNNKGRQTLEKIYNHVISVLNAGRYKMRSKNVTQDGMDLIYEVKVRRDKELIADISKIEGISNVSLLAHDGEVV